MKLKWGDIGGGATPRSPASAGAENVAAEAEDTTSLVEKANTWFDEVLGLLRKIDEVFGYFLQFKARQDGQTIESNQPSRIDQAAPNPGPSAPDTTAILALLDSIIAGKGDIPLSEFVAAIRNQEKWLIEYMVKGGQDETGA